MRVWGSLPAPLLSMGAGVGSSESVLAAGLLDGRVPGSRVLIFGGAACPGEAPPSRWLVPNGCPGAVCPLFGFGVTDTVDLGCGGSARARATGGCGACPARAVAWRPARTRTAPC